MPATDLFPAQVVLHPAIDTQIEAGSTVLLTCVAYGVPLPSLSWSRNGSFLSLNDSHVTVYPQVVADSGSGVVFMKSIVKLCRSQLTDAGIYSCSAENELGMHNFSFQVTIIHVEGKSNIIFAQLFNAVYSKLTREPIHSNNGDL